MEFQDNDPERRNLVMTSFAFILYSWGGGSFDDGDINFQIVNLHFSNTIALAVIAWVMLFWFYYRYWLKHSDTFRKKFTEEISKYKGHSFIKNYCSKRTGYALLPEIKFNHHFENSGVEYGYFISHIDKGLRGYCIKVQYLKSLKRDPKTGLIVEQVNTEFPNDDRFITSEDIPFDGAIGRLTFLRLYLLYCFKEHNFSSHVVPYILFFVAAISGIIQYFVLM